MSFTVKDNCIFERNHVMQGDGFAVSIKVTDGQSVNQNGKTFYQVDLDNVLSGGLSFESFAQLCEFSEILSDFCKNEQNVLIGRDYERFMVEQVKQIRISRQKERRKNRRDKKREKRRGKHPDTSDDTL